MRFHLFNGLVEARMAGFDAERVERAMKAKHQNKR